MRTSYITLPGRSDAEGDFFLSIPRGFPNEPVEIGSKAQKTGREIITDLLGKLPVGTYANFHDDGARGEKDPGGLDNGVCEGAIADKGLAGLEFPKDLDLPCGCFATLNLRARRARGE
jgi:hypothetical protein